jgi:hypothetical protein
MEQAIASAAGPRLRWFVAVQRIPTLRAPGVPDGGRRRVAALRRPGRQDSLESPFTSLKPRHDAVPDPLLRCSVTGVTNTG